MTLDETLQLVKRLLHGHTDWKGREFWRHDVDVMNLLPHDATFKEKQAALLHSIYDFNAASEQELRQHGISQDVLDIVGMVVSGPEVRGYTAFIKQCRAIARSGNISVLRVKLADLKANQDHPTKRYDEAIHIISEGLTAVYGDA